MDLNNDLKRSRLLAAVKASREATSCFRRTRTEMIRDYVGSWYSTRGARCETLVNMMNQTARVFSRFLAANNPRVKVVSENPQNWSFGKRFEINLNKMIVDMELDASLRLMILDAFFCMGIAKVTLADSGKGIQESEDVWYDIGEPWVERISLDNAILDVAANSLTKMRFCGDIFRCSLEKLNDDHSYSRRIVKRLRPTSKHSHDDNEDLAARIAAGDVVDDDELEPMVTLQNLWIPDRDGRGGGQIATFACDTDYPPLRSSRYKGTQSGPYKFLSLGFVPDNIIPSSPASNLKGLHDLINRNARKLDKQSRMLKENPVYEPGGEEDAERYEQARYGQWVKSRNSKGVNVIKIGGPDGNLAAFQLSMMDTYDRVAGNMKAAAGLGPQAATLGQEEIIQEQVAAQQADLQFHVVKFASDICWELGNLMWQDEFLEIESSIEVGKFGDTIDTSWRPGNRKGEFSQYDFRVEPYSMIYRTPQQKVQEIFGVMRELAPMWPMFQASGVSLDVADFMDVVADLLDRPELKRIFTMAFPSDQLGGDQNTIRQSPITTRETVRRNIPTGGTAENRSAVLQQAFLGGGQNNKQQVASLSRAPA